MMSGRLRFEGPDPGTWSWGHGGDEYGNCSLYVRTPLFGIIWFYPTGHYQTEIELPGFGECAWVDGVILGGDGE
jgi:hypothetical protein